MLSDNRNSAIESNSAFTTKIEDLVKEIVIQNNILCYRIESRVDHITNPGGADEFMPVVRVITYFEDTVSQISDLLHAEFEVVEETSVDKKKSRIESFSYKHVQYLVRLKANRRELTEYKRSGDKKFEIQVCSMLQDAWAGIEKELGYDSAAFPEEGKRDLYRVGALLEMADLEFLKIRSKFISQPPVAAEPVVARPETYSVETPAPVPQPEIVMQAPPAPAKPQVIINDFIPEPQPVKREEIKQDPVVAEAPTPAPQVMIAEPEILMPQPRKEAEPKISVSGVGLSGMIHPEEEAETAPVHSSAFFEEITQPVQDTVTPAPAPVEEAPAVAAKTEVPVPEVPAQPVMQQTINVEQMKVNNIESMKVHVNGNGSMEQEKEAEEATALPFFEDLIEEKAKTINKPAPLDENAPITDASLKEYVQKSKLLKEIDLQIAERAGARINPDIDIEGDVERLRFLKVYTLKQLHERLKDNKDDVVSFAEKWIGKDNGGSFDSGISLFYLEYLLVGKKNDPAFAVEYVVKFISDNDYSARYIIPTYNSIRNTEAPNFSHLTLK